MTLGSYWTNRPFQELIDCLNSFNHNQIRCSSNSIEQASISNENDPLSQEIYKLAIKQNRTTQDDKRLNGLHDLRNRLASLSQTKATERKTRFVQAPPEPNPILKFADITKEPTSERYSNPMPQFKRINSRYNAEESRY